MNDILCTSIMKNIHYLVLIYRILCILKTCNSKNYMHALLERKKIFEKYSAGRMPKLKLKLLLNLSLLCVTLCKYRQFQHRLSCQILSDILGCGFKLFIIFSQNSGDRKTNEIQFCINKILFKNNLLQTKFIKCIPRI